MKCNLYGTSRVTDDWSRTCPPRFAFNKCKWVDFASASSRKRLNFFPKAESAEVETESRKNTDKQISSRQAHPSSLTLNMDLVQKKNLYSSFFYTWSLNLSFRRFINLLAIQVSDLLSFNWNYTYFSICICFYSILIVLWSVCFIPC